MGLNARSTVVTIAVAAVLAWLASCGTAPTGPGAVDASRASLTPPDAEPTTTAPLTTPSTSATYASTSPTPTTHATPTAGGTTPFRVIRSWRLADSTVGLATTPDAVYRLSDVEVAGGDLDGSGIVLSRLDRTTGTVLVHRSLPGAASMAAAGSLLWVVVRPATDRPAQIVELDPHSLRTVRRIVPPAGDLTSPPGDYLGGLAVAGGRIWTSYGHHYLAYDQTDGRLALDITAPAGLVAGSVDASGDGSTVWTAAFSQWTPVVPVEERDGRTGRTLASGRANAHTFAGAGDVEWTTMTGGMSTQLARIEVDGTTLRVVPDAPFDLPSLQFAAAGGVLWVTAVHTIACVDPTTGAARLQIWPTTTWYDDPTPLGDGRLLVKRGEEGADLSLLTIEPDPRYQA